MPCGSAYLRALACKMHAKNPPNVGKLARISEFSVKLPEQAAVRAGGFELKAE